jgi:hypothetical protein
VVDPDSPQERVRVGFARVTTHAREPGAPPADDVDRFLYGVAQPFLGLRVLWSTPSLRQPALFPVLAVLLVAGLVTIGKASASPARILWTYYVTVGTLASVPAVLFANTYARIAAAALPVLGFEARPPILITLRESLKQAVQAAILVALGVAPVLLVLRHVPLLGGMFAWIASAAWALHWIIVEALDGARVAEPHVGEARPPWFAGWTTLPMWDGAPAPLRGAVRKFGRLLVRLSRPWVEEVALVARHPALAVGFGLATAALLAVPIANLLLRPAILVGAVHLRAQLARREC